MPFTPKESKHGHWEKREEGWEFHDKFGRVWRDVEGLNPGFEVTHVSPPGKPLHINYEDADGKTFGVFERDDGWYTGYLTDEQVGFFTIEGYVPFGPGTDYPDIEPKAWTSQPQEPPPPMPPPDVPGLALGAPRDIEWPDGTTRSTATDQHGRQWDWYRDAQGNEHVGYIDNYGTRHDVYQIEQGGFWYDQWTDKDGYGHEGRIDEFGNVHDRWFDERTHEYREEVRVPATEAEEARTSAREEELDRYEQAMGRSSQPLPPDNAEGSEAPPPAGLPEDQPAEPVGEAAPAAGYDSSGIYGPWMTEYEEEAPPGGGDYAPQETSPLQFGNTGNLENAAPTPGAPGAPGPTPGTYWTESGELVWSGGHSVPPDGPDTPEPPTPEDGGGGIPGVGIPYEDFIPSYPMVKDPITGEWRNAEPGEIPGVEDPGDSAEAGNGGTATVEVSGGSVESAEAGNGGIAEADAPGGAVSIGDTSSGVSADGGTAIADAGGGSVPVSAEGGTAMADASSGVGVDGGPIPSGAPEPTDPTRPDVSVPGDAPGGIPGLGVPYVDFIPFYPMVEDPNTGEWRNAEPGELSGPQSVGPLQFGNTGNLQNASEFHWLSNLFDPNAPGPTLDPDLFNPNVPGLTLDPRAALLGRDGPAIDPTLLDPNSPGPAIDPSTLGPAYTLDLKIVEPGDPRAGEFGYVSRDEIFPPAPDEPESLVERAPGTGDPETEATPSQPPVDHVAGEARAEADVRSVGVEPLRPYEPGIDTESAAVRASQETPVNQNLPDYVDLTSPPPPNVIINRFPPDGPYHDPAILPTRVEGTAADSRVEPLRPYEPGMGTESAAAGLHINEVESDPPAPTSPPDPIGPVASGPTLQAALFDPNAPGPTLDPNLFDPAAPGPTVAPNLLDPNAPGPTIDPALLDPASPGPTLDPNLLDENAPGETIDPNTLDPAAPGPTVDPAALDPTLTDPSAVPDPALADPAAADPALDPSLGQPVATPVNFEDPMMP